MVQLEHSFHWRKTKKYRKDISDDFIIYAVENSPTLRDRSWHNTYNSIARIPPSGRLLKVVYKRISRDKIRIITAFWMD